MNTVIHRNAVENTGCSHGLYRTYCSIVSSFLKDNSSYPTRREYRRE